MTTCTIIEEVSTELAAYSEVPISFTVSQRLRVDLIDGGLGGFRLKTRVVDPPYVKDYDAIKGEGPTRWARRFDMSNWGILSAHIDGQRVGGIIMAWNSDGVSMLEDRSDLAVIWDVRVDDAARGQGVGRTLFGAGEQWARERGCKWLKVETQNINVGACRFYAKMGCHLGAIDQHAYEDLPDEVQMLWVKQL